MNLGKQIRANRLRLNMTQERLAEKLNVTAQAVSKWENENGLPDISILPELSAVLGVTIDELFDASEEMHLSRIEAMLERNSMLSREDFDYAISRLKGMLHKAEYKGRCLSLMADLYMHRSEGYAEQAAQYAKQALDIDPQNKSTHTALFRAWRGSLGDWCYSNHTRLIEFYQNFIIKNPDYLPGYMWLIDNLIEDGRLPEAKQTAEKMRKVKETYHFSMYMALIAQKEGHIEQAEQLWKQLLNDYQHDSHAWFVYADHRAKQASYPEAIEAFEKSFALAQCPRFTDALDSIAQLCQINGDKAGAIDAYERILQVMEDDWKITEGETVEGYMLNIKALKA